MNMSVAITEDKQEALPENYKVLLENNSVRVLEYQSRPGERSAIHLRPGTILYALTSAKLMTTVPYISELDLKIGEAITIEHDTQAVENTGASNDHILIFELKEPEMTHEEVRVK